MITKIVSLYNNPFNGGARAGRDEEDEDGHDEDDDVVVLFSDLYICYITTIRINEVHQ
jgi:hypothetical protein